MLQMILQKNHDSFQMIPNKKMVYQFADIVICKYILGILELIPKSYADFLLRSYYGKLVTWAFNYEQKLNEAINNNEWNE